MNKNTTQLLPLCALLLSGLLLVSGPQSAAAKAHHADAAEHPITAASFPATEAQPNAPSLARTDAGRVLSPSDWEDPAICGGCHTTQYQGWKGSMHSNSFRDPIFQAEWALAEKQVGGEISNLCGGCHTPVGMLTRTIKFDPELGEHGGFTAPAIAENGVFCDVCHTISDTSYHQSSVQEHGNGSYVSSPGKVKRGPLKDAVSPYHETEYSEHHSKAAFCGNCHNIFNPINNFPLERTYDEWKYSVYAQNDVQCQDCHMVPVETAMRVADTLTPAKKLPDHGLGGQAAIGAAGERDLVHGHGFVGGNAVVTAVVGDPDSRRHAGIAIKRLRSAASLELALEKVPGQAGMHRLQVKVTNERAGHHLPTSLTFIRELWLEVAISDQNGNELLHSGALDEHNELDPNATLFKAFAVDKGGKPAQFIWTVERFERRTTIPPKGHQYGSYYFNLPAGSEQLKVRARLNYRSFSQHFADHLLGEGKLHVPTVTMNDIETTFAVTDLNTLASVDHLKQSDSELETARLLEEYLGPEKAATDTHKLVKACAACHGLDGLALAPDVPDLAGQNLSYLLSALRAYKSGTRTEPRMNAMIRNVSDSQLNELASYYSNLSAK